MMKIALLTIALLGYVQIFAQQYTDEPKQQTEQVKSLLSADNDLTGFGNIDFRFTSIKGSQAFVMGAYGGLMINRRVMLGIAGYGLASSVAFDGIIPETATAEKLNLYVGYGGIILGGIVASKEVVHLSFPVVVAVGKLDVSNDSYFNQIGSSDRSFVVESSNFFVIEPSAKLELNVSKSFRIGLGAGYRLVKALELENVSDDDMSSFSGLVSFTFGGF